MANGKASEELATLTYRQFWATVVEIGALIVTIVFTAWAAIAASIAAKAARTSITTLERPFLYIAVDETDFDGYTSWAAFEAATQGTEAYLPQVPFTLKNYGRTPAILTEVRTGLAFDVDAPGGGTAQLQSLPRERVIPPDGESSIFIAKLTVPKEDEFWKFVSRELEVDRPGGKRLWFYGWINYRSALGISVDYETEFLWSYDDRGYIFSFGPYTQHGHSRNRAT